MQSFLLESDSELLVRLDWNLPPTVYLVSHLARVHVSVSPTPSNPILHAGQKLVHVEPDKSAKSWIHDKIADVFVRVQTFRRTFLWICSTLRACSGPNVIEHAHWSWRSWTARRRMRLPTKWTKLEIKIVYSCWEAVMVVVKVLDDKEGASARIHEICQKFPDSNYAKNAYFATFANSQQKCVIGLKWD